MHATNRKFHLRISLGSILPITGFSCSRTQKYSTDTTRAHNYNDCGPGSSVDIATELRAGRTGIESRWGRDVPPVQTGPGAHPASCITGTGSFLGGGGGRGVLLTTHPLLVPRSWKSRAIPLPTLRAFVAYKKDENLPTFFIAELWLLQKPKYVVSQKKLIMNSVKTDGL